MEIVAALFVENIQFRQVEGPSTRIDITGAFFSTRATEFPAHLAPHLVVLVRVPKDAASGSGTLETRFVNEAGVEVGRNVQPFEVEPGKFGYRLVKGELEYESPSTIEAHCTIAESGSSVVVPLTVIA
ncbi:MAG TPA: hypothetical protein VH914_04420 [Acidimicrobiia bacterium]|jgi:hypothetical protein|nr:hypothetical protein [Acidimicrobiia bacterium]